MNSFKIKSKLTGSIYTASQAEELPDSWIVDYGNEYGYVHKDKLFLGFTLVQESETAKEPAWKKHCENGGTADTPGPFKFGFLAGYEAAKKDGS